MVVSIFIIASGERISIQEARIDRVRLRSHAASPKAHAQCYFRIPERLKPQHRITSLLYLPVILLNHVVQVLAGPDEPLSGQYAFGLQFGDGLMGRLTAVERDLLR